MPDPIGSFDLTWPFYAAALIGYLVGAIPFGLLLTRLAGVGDLRKIGSGNIGATNVLRTGRKDLALATLVLDSGKGALIAYLAQRYYGPDIGVLAGGGAFLGHVFPIWLRFRGGKGMATFLGVLLALSPWVGLGACATWALVALVLRYSSLAAMLAAIAAPIYAYLLQDYQHMELAIAMAAILIVRHHGNIRRLVTGKEPRIGRS